MATEKKLSLVQRKSTRTTHREAPACATLEEAYDPDANIYPSTLARAYAKPQVEMLNNKLKLEMAAKLSVYARGIVEHAANQLVLRDGSKNKNSSLERISPLSYEVKGRR